MVLLACLKFRPLEQTLLKGFLSSVLRTDIPVLRTVPGTYYILHKYLLNAATISKNSEFVVCFSRGKKVSARDTKSMFYMEAPASRIPTPCDNGGNL